MMSTIDVTEIRSPLGPLMIAVRDGRLCAVDLGNRPDLHDRLAACGDVRRNGRRAAAPVLDRLRAYCDGDLKALAASEVQPLWGTPFQRRVWSGLRSIPSGETVSYAQLARRIRSPKAVRAVGSANGANPIPLVLPCHRVVASDGGLGGYGGGLPMKRWLLGHEGVALSSR
jgi:methylated-DNA-[protein]-cysteine S-methyltransferase